MAIQPRGAPVNKPGDLITNPSGVVTGGYDSTGAVASFGAPTTPPPVTRYTTPAPTTPTNPVVPAPATAPVVVPTSPTLPNYPTTSQPALAPVDENAIREQTRQRMQSSIDAINAQFAGLIAQENVAGQDRSGQTRAINARSGLMGSDFGSAQQEKTTQFNKSQVQALEVEKNAHVQSILQNIEDRASAEIRAKKEEALGQYTRDQATYQQAQEQARGDLKALAGKGIDLATLNPAQKAALLKQAGYDDPNFGELVYNAMKPKASQIDFKFEKLADGQGLFYGVDPTTGQLVTKNVKVDLPDGYNLTIAPDGTPLIFNKNDGTAKIADGFGKQQFAKPEDGLDAQKKALEIEKLKKDLSGRGDLTPAQQNAAFKLVDDYEKASGDLTKITANYNRVIASAKNPTAAGDLSLIFAYMKTLDPTSVVREGEFATAATAGSIPDRIWGQYNKIINGERLSDPIRQDFVARAGELYKAATEQQKQVDQAFSQRAQKFGIDPSYVVRDQSSYNDTGGGGQLNTNDPQVQTLKNAGYNDDEIRAALGFNNVGSDTKQAPKPGDANFIGPVFSSVKLGSPLAVANNNPGNLRYVGQAGAKPGKGGFASFPTPEAGVKALSSQIQLDAGRGHTLASFINKYAPPVENNTSVYLQQATKALGVSPSTKLASIDHNALLKFMAKKESSTIIA